MGTGRFQSIIFLLLFKLWQLSPLFPYSLSHPAHPLPIPSQSPHYCLCQWVVHTCSLVHLFTISHPIPSTSFPAAVGLFYVAKLLLLSCSLVCCVHRIPYISEIMWHISFTDWFNSLSIIFSRSLHAVAKWKSLLFSLLSSIPLCTCTTAFLSPHLLMDAGAASVSWWL